MVINARSLRNKLLDFQAVVYTREIDIVIVSETWLDNTVSDYGILPNGYTIFRKDRIGRKAVMCCWHSNLRSRPEEDIT